MATSRIPTLRRRGRYSSAREAPPCKLGAHVRRRPMVIALRCLMGMAAPADLGAHLASVLDLPDAVQGTFAEVLDAYLVPVLDDRVQTFVKRYCRRYELEPAVLIPSAMAARYLFTNAAKAGVDGTAFMTDVRALVPEPRASLVLERLLPLFEMALPKLRQAAVMRSVAEHGRVVRAVRWRMDVIRASDHAIALDVPVATITLQYQEGANASQASYQFLPEQAAELKRALGFIVD